MNKLTLQFLGFYTILVNNNYILYKQVFHILNNNIKQNID